jgi:hypothetical protein
MVAGGRYSLFGRTMGLGFTDDMFEGGVRDQLIDVYPNRAHDINLLGCRQDQTSML